MENFKIVKLICLGNMEYLEEWELFRCLSRIIKDNNWVMEFLEEQVVMMKYLNGI